MTKVQYKVIGISGVDARGLERILDAEAEAGWAPVVMSDRMIVLSRIQTHTWPPTSPIERT